MKNFAILFILVAILTSAYYFGSQHNFNAKTLAIYTIFIFVVGMGFGEIRGKIYSGMRFNAIKREQERSAITSTESQAKVKVLEAKIQTLEKALENALKK